MCDVISTFALVQTSGVKNSDPNHLDETGDQPINACQADIMALDDVSLKNCGNVLLQLRKWCRKGIDAQDLSQCQTRLSIQIPMSWPTSKNCTECSKRPDEFLQTSKNDDQRPSPLFMENKAILGCDLGDPIWPFGIKESVSQKHFATGGSVQWMLGSDQGEAEKDIMKSINGQVQASGLPLVAEARHKVLHW